MKRTPKETWRIIGPVLLRKYKRSKTFLDYANPFELLISVILSAQTTDDAVNKVTKNLFAKYPSYMKLAKAPLHDIESIIYPLGYYRSKAKYIKETARLLATSHKGKVPLTISELLLFPGVGRKTAVAVISNTADPNVGIAVDTHVIRFARRFALSKASNPDTIEKDLQKIIPKKDWKRASYAIKEYGRKEGSAKKYIVQNDPLQQAISVYEKTATKVS